MENEKLENQKIGENKMEDVAGGYGIKSNHAYDSKFSFDSLQLNENEYAMLKKAGCIKKGTTKMSKEKLKKALNLLDRKSQFDPTRYKGPGIHSYYEINIE